jgi:hypothetical protein
VGHAQLSSHSSGPSSRGGSSIIGSQLPVCCVANFWFDWFRGWQQQSCRRLQLFQQQWGGTLGEAGRAKVQLWLRSLVCPGVQPLWCACHTTYTRTAAWLRSFLYQQCM